MFGNNKKEGGKGSTGLSSNLNSLNTLVKGAVVEGTVKSESDIRVDGAIKGKLHCDAKVIIGPTGHVDGEIHCKNAVIEGKLEGSLTVLGLLDIRSSAQIKGDVTTQKLIVQSGALFNVSCTMGQGVKRAGSKHSINNGQAHGEPKSNGGTESETKSAEVR